MAPSPEHLHLCLMHSYAAHSVCSPPPCGEGLGVGVRLRITARPPPRRFAPTLPTRGRVRPRLRLADFLFHFSSSRRARVTSSSSTCQISSLSCPNSGDADNVMRLRGRENGTSTMRLMRPGWAV